MLNMGWSGDLCFVMYSFVKQAQPSNSSPVLQRLPVKTVQGMRDTAFPSAVCPCDKSGSTPLCAFEPVYLVIPIWVPGSAAILEDRCN